MSAAKNEATALIQLRDTLAARVGFAPFNPKIAHISYTDLYRLKAAGLAAIHSCAVSPTTYVLWRLFA